MLPTWWSFKSRRAKPSTGHSQPSRGTEGCPPRSRRGMKAAWRAAGFQNVGSATPSPAAQSQTGSQAKYTPQILEQLET